MTIEPPLKINSPADISPQLSTTITSLHHPDVQNDSRPYLLPCTDGLLRTLTADPSRIPSMVAGPPGEPQTVAVETVPAADFARLKPGTGSSVYAHGCILYHDVMTDQVRPTEFCVRYSGADDYTMCDNANLME